MNFTAQRICRICLKTLKSTSMLTRRQTRPGQPKNAVSSRQCWPVRALPDNRQNKQPCNASCSHRLIRFGALRVAVTAVTSMGEPLFTKEDVSLACTVDGVFVMGRICVASGMRWACAAGHAACGKRATSCWARLQETCNRCFRSCYLFVFGSDECKATCILSRKNPQQVVCDSSLTERATRSGLCCWHETAARSYNAMAVNSNCNTWAAINDNMPTRLNFLC